MTVSVRATTHMEPIQTPFTNLLGIKSPIVAGAMAGASGGALAAQVTLGGGFGFLSAGYDSPETLRKEIHLARELLHSTPGSTVPVGVGFLCWQLDAFPSKAEQLLSIVLASDVQAVWLSFGDDIGRWVTYVRDHDPRAGTKDAVKIFIQISTVPEAQRALHEWRADVIVAQGIEAGGHGLGSALPLLTLLPLVAQLLPKSDAPPLLAAGGIATGAHVAALLVLGASGVVLGTRFLLSPESLYTDVQRRALLAADSSQSVRTMAFDYARNTLGWPAGIDGRALRNATVDDFARGEDITVLREKFDRGVRKEDPNRILVWAGSGVGLMSQIKPAKDIVQELHAECTQSLTHAASLLGVASKPPASA